MNNRTLVMAGLFGIVLGSLVGVTLALLNTEDKLDQCYSNTAEAITIAEECVDLLKKAAVVLESCNTDPALYVTVQ